MGNLVCTHCGTEHSGEKRVYRCEHCGGVLKKCLIDGKYIFRVSRASSPWHKTGKPCAEAWQEEYFHIDWRTTDDPAKTEAYGGETDWWYNEGINHRVENGMIARDLKRKGWFIEFDGFDALLKFINSGNRVVITDEKQYHYDLLIYDDWIE